MTSDEQPQYLINSRYLKLIDNTTGSWGVVEMTSDERYLDLLIKTLTNQIYLEHEHVILNQSYFQGTTEKGRLELRKMGLDLPRFAHTMVGQLRLEEIQRLTRVIQRKGIAGDFIDCGVWRGGTSIFMRACMDVYGLGGKMLWMADSFEGLPKPDDRYEADAGDVHHEKTFLAVSVDEVMTNLHTYLGSFNTVKVLPGFFENTLHGLVGDLALIRIDADMYGSTTHCLDALYPLLKPGGIVIVDDYETLPACKKAVDDFREKRGITDHIEMTTHNSGFWTKS